MPSGLALKWPPMPMEASALVLARVLALVLLVLVLVLVLVLAGLFCLGLWVAGLGWIAWIGNPPEWLGHR